MRQQGVDILNTHSSLDSWVGTLAWASLRRRPVLVRTRHLSTPVSQSFPTRWLYNTPAAVITTSQEIAELLHHRLGVPRPRLFAIPTGVSLADFTPRPADPELKAGLGLPEGTFLFGTVSVLRSWKGHLHLLEGFHLLAAEGRPVGLLIVGDGPYRPVIEAKIQELDLAGRVRLVGHQDQVPPWLALLDAFVLASYANEGVPQALLQALAMARPVAATAVGGIPEVITPGETGLLAPPRDPKGLALAMRRLMDEPGAGQAMGDRGRELVAAKFSLKHMAMSVAAVYDRLTGEGPMSRASRPKTEECT